MLCKGIKLGEEKNYVDAKKCFEKARSMFKLKVEPSFYLAVSSAYFSSYP